MKYIEYNINLDIRKMTPQAVVRAKRGTTAAALMITLSEGGIPYEIAEGCTATFKGVKPDGNKLYNPCEINGDIIRYIFTEQTSVLAGLVRCELKLFGADGEEMVTPCFDIIFDEELFNDGEIVIPSESESLSLGEFAELVEETNRKLEAGEFDGVGIETVEQTTVSTEDGGQNVITITLQDGRSFEAVIRNGNTPKKGVDYWTPEEKAQVSADVLADVKDGLFPVGIEGGGTNATNVLDALKNLGLIASAYTAAPASFGHTVNSLSEHPLWQSGMSTFEFINALPNNTIVSFGANTNVAENCFSDAPETYGEYAFFKGYNNNYVIGFCVKAGSTVPKIWMYGVSNDTSSGKWRRILIADDFVVDGDSLYITL